MKKIALVEDNIDNRVLFKTILENSYDVDEYETGHEALASFKKRKPDLVLLDISLPEMDGREILRRMRDDPSLRTIPVIAVTAHAMAGDRESLLSGGFDDYVSKPVVDENILLNAITRLLNSKKQR